MSSKNTPAANKDEMCAVTTLQWKSISIDWALIWSVCACASEEAAATNDSGTINNSDTLNCAEGLGPPGMEEKWRFNEEQATLLQLLTETSFCFCVLQTLRITSRPYGNPIVSNHFPYVFCTAKTLT